MDISNRNKLEEFFSKNKINIVVNLAAQPGVRYSIENPYAYLDSNLIGFMNILELCRHYEVEGLVYASSSSVYGNNKKIPFNIDDKSDSPIALYGATKKANELMAHSYSHLYNLHSTGLRYFTVYGPWGRPDMAMNIFCDKIINDQPLSVYNDGDMKRNFTFIDDVVEATKNALIKNYKYEIFNIASNKTEKLMDVISVMETCLKKKAIIDFQSIQPGDIKESFANIDKTKMMLDYEPQTSIRRGIPKLIEWFNNFYK